MTVTKSITNTKLLVATGVMLAAGGLAFATVPLSYQNAQGQKCGVNSYSVSQNCGGSSYRQAKITCHDGSSYNLGGPTSCKPAKTWETYAQKQCYNRCAVPVSAPQLTMARASDYVSGDMILDNRFLMDRFILSASNQEDIQLNRMTFAILRAGSGTFSGRNWKLSFNDGAQEFQSEATYSSSLSGSVTFDTNVIIPKGTNVRATLYTDTTESQGDVFVYTALRDPGVVARGVSSAQNAQIMGLPIVCPTRYGEFPTMTTSTAFPVVALRPLDSTRLMNGTGDLFKFTITAASDDISLYGVTFDIQSYNVSVDNLYLYDVTNSSFEIQLNSTTGTAGLWQTVGSDWATNYPNKEIAISGGTSRTFVVRGNIRGATIGSAVMVRLAGDANSIPAGSAAQIDASADGDFIWSDRSNASHGITTDDWFNGYGVSGLPATFTNYQTLAY
ncbi:MAG: hypothetical protein WCW16_04190 [Candidatus Magasanikbacteria bacterium]